MGTCGLKVDAFDYELPEELIAQTPAERRTDARMMVVDRATGRLTHSRVSEIGAWLQAGDVLVVNNTKVIPARIHGYKEDTGGKVELLLLEPQREGVWLVLCRSGRQPQEGSHLVLAHGRLHATVLDQGEAGRLTVRLQGDAPLYTILDAEGDVPLPPYIRRQSDAYAGLDRERYQTVYASQPGAVAAPTAGLHFTPDLLAQLAEQGIPKAEITLHVGIGTFRPVRVADVAEHRMDEERYEVGAAAAATIAGARASGGGRIVAVGSTSVRTLETVMQRHGRVCADSGRSDLFIYPPYAFQAVDAMLTNFHLPRSTLLMMVSALAGTELMQAAYAEAVRETYRFFSYGDCMLIL